MLSFPTLPPGIIRGLSCSVYSTCPVFKREGTGRADADTLTAFQTPVPADGFIGKGSNYPLKAAVGKAEDSCFLVLAAYPDAPPAEDALIRVVSEQRVTVVHREFPK